MVVKISKLWKRTEGADGKGSAARRRLVIKVECDLGQTNRSKKLKISYTTKIKLVSATFSHENNNTTVINKDIVRVEPRR